MKKRTLFILLILSSITFSQKQNFETTSTADKMLDVNNIYFRISDPYKDRWSRSFGDVHWDVEEYSSEIVFDHGMWLTGKIGDSVKSAIREWWYQYSPGPIIDGLPALDSHPEDSLKYRIYKITQNDDESNPDYAEWPAEFGAPVDNDGNPRLYGNQMLWSTYNFLDTSYVPNHTYYTPNSEDRLKYIFPVEVRETVYAHAAITHKDDDLLSNTVLIEYEFINKGDVQIDSAYWGFWTDIDFHDLFDNNPLIDTTRQLGLCYSFENHTFYGSSSPAVGYTLLYGPQVESANSTAVYKGKVVNGKKNLNLNTFHPIEDDSIYMPADSSNVFPNHLEANNLMGPIYVYTQAWNVARGNGAYNIPYYDPYSEEYTNFPFSGNPETGEGWYAYENEPGRNGGGAGFVFFAGPFDFAPSDTQWVMVALVPALGEDNFDSITKLKSKVDQLRSLPYDSLAISNRIISSVDDKNESLYLDYELKQNYPNPFNPTTKIEYSLPEKNQVKIEVFNLLGQKVATLINTEQSAGRHSVNWNAESFSSGIYFYKISAGSFVETKKMMVLK
jgi:hypothetical protein